MALLVASASRTADAQLTIQQPVFGVNSVATTVSVPDRGQVFLGGVKRAGESRTSTGPLRAGTNTGLFREASGISVTATIHDFEAMDEFLLNQPMRNGPVASSHIDDPYQQLLARSQRRDQAAVAAPRDILSGAPLCHGRCAVPASAMPSRFEDAPPPPEPKGAADGGETSYRLGLSAEDRGAAGVAKLHYRLAARRGHALAQSRLARLTEGASPTEVAGNP